MTTMDSADLFAETCHRLGVQPDRRGEVHVDCPWCGKEAKRGQVHFSFSERGSRCFVCGGKAGLRELARVWGIIEGQPAPPVQRERVAPRLPEPQRALRQRQPLDGGARGRAHAMMRQFASHPEAVSRWQAYKPMHEAVIRAYRLGYGAYGPYLSQCRHDRLQAPLVTTEGEIAGFRSRSVVCQCAKWLSSAGSKMLLYNGGRVGRGATFGEAHGRCHEDTLMIVENPIDALMLEAAYPVMAVGTLGVSMWRPEWTEALARVRLRSVIVAYDNDRPGNGGGDRGKADWLRTHERDIEPNGIRLTNALLEAGVRAELWRWPKEAPLRYDVGTMLMQGAMV
jgi:hypothetical protein